ncbi:MAG: ABC transporter family substrate-binding protein [Ilumatobacteraceae bacterium]
MNKRTIRRFAMIAAVTLLPVVSASTVAHAAKGDGPDINAQPVGNLKQGGTFVWAINSLPDNYNTSQIDGNVADTSYIMNGLLPSMFTVNASGALVVDKNYASSVTLTSKKPQIVTYILNPRAKWSNGKPLSLADFVGLWKANNGSNPAYEIISTTGYEDIASVKKGSAANSVVVTFKKAFPDWQSLFGGIIPAALTASPTAFNTSWKNGPNVTAGPFKYSSTNETAQTVTVVRNPAWWGPKAVLEKIVYRAIPPATQLDALANGEVDYIDIGPSSPNFKRASGMSGVKVHVSKAPNYRHMTFGSATAVSRNLRVRQAIMMGIDRSTITRAMISTIDPKATSMDNHVFVKGLSCYQDNSGIYGKQNLLKADQLLDAAGYTGNPRKDSAGNALKIAITIPSGVPTSASEAQLMQAMLQPLGVPLEIKVVPLADFFSKYILPGDYEMTVFSWLGTTFPISSSSSIFKTDGDQNFGKIGTAAIDGLFARANLELDPVKRCALANSADKLIWEVGHSMIMYQRPNVTATDRKLANMGSFGFTSIDYTKIGFQK